MITGQLVVRMAVSSALGAWISLEFGLHNQGSVETFALT
jgi:hypothetical protein